MKRSVIFDFDGTIADSFDYVYEFLCDEAKISPVDRADKMDAYRHMSMKKMALDLGIAPWKLPYIYFKGRRVMRRHVMNVEPFSGVPDLIKRLHKQNYELYIISSNSGSNIKKFLRRHELLPYFRSVRGGAGVMGKVSLIRKLKRKYKINDEACWYVGDEVGDMVSAKVAGVKSVGVTWGFAGDTQLDTVADAVVHRAERIERLLQ